jgi:hypothetical protein
VGAGDGRIDDFERKPDEKFLFIEEEAVSAGH